MAAFVWEGKTKDGAFRNGVMEAKTAEEVMQKLRNQAITPSKVKKKALEIRLPKLPGLGGVGLEILGTQSENRALKDILMGVKETVEGGSTFAEALKKYPKVFDELYVNLVAAGEVGGILDTILNRLAVYIEKNMKLRKKVKGAMVYPICIVIVAIAVMLILLYYVIPVFEKMFEDFGSKQALPAMTQSLIDFSRWMRDNWYIVLALAVGIPTAVHFFKRWPKGRYMWDKAMLKLPIFGSLFRKVAVARFSRTLGTMVSSGVPILDALEIVAKSAGNRVVEEGVYYTREKISEGKTMAEPLAECGVFPGMVVQMIAVGESTGALDQMLGKIADFYDEEVDVAVDALTSLMEPLMLVLLGGMVGYFLIAMYMPIFNLASVVG
jgi:type IV pilus assembly protein PilC